MQDEQMKALAKDFLGMSEADMARVTPEQELQYKNTMENMGKFRLVAEVKKARYCAGGLQVGQKFVFDGVQIDKNASDCPLCVGVIAPLERALVVYLDRTALEVFAADGLTYVPMPFIPRSDDLSLELVARGGAVKFSRLEVHELKSIWEQGRNKR